MDLSLCFYLCEHGHAICNSGTAHIREKVTSCGGSGARITKLMMTMIIFVVRSK